MSRFTGRHLSGPRQVALWRLQLAATAGALMVASMPPHGLWFLFPAGTAVLVVSLHNTVWRNRRLLGGAAGLTYLGPGLFWVASFTPPGTSSSR